MNSPGATWWVRGAGSTLVGMGPEWFVVIGVVVLLFGGSQLPKLARSVGQAQKEFKKGIEEGERDEAPSKDEGASS